MYVRLYACVPVDVCLIWRHLFVSLILLPAIIKEPLIFVTAFVIVTVFVSSYHFSSRLVTEPTIYDLSLLLLLLFLLLFSPRRCRQHRCYARHIWYLSCLSQDEGKLRRDSAAVDNLSILIINLFVTRSESLTGCWGSHCCIHSFVWEKLIQSARNIMHTDILLQCKHSKFVSAIQMLRQWDKLNDGAISRQVHKSRLVGWAQNQREKGNDRGDHRVDTSTRSCAGE